MGNASSEFVFGVYGVESVFAKCVFGIRLQGVYSLRGGIRLRKMRLRSSSSGCNSSFGADVLFTECVFGNRLRGAIRLRRGNRLQGIRLRNSSSGCCSSLGVGILFAECIFGNRLRNSSLSAGGEVIPAQRPRCVYFFHNVSNINILPGCICQKLCQNNVTRWISRDHS